MLFKLLIMEEKIAKKRILVVDDEIRLVDSVSLILKMANYEVETANCGLEAPFKNQTIDRT